MKFAPGLLLLALSSGLLLILIQVEVVGIAFDKLGLSTSAAALWMIACLLGSRINVPITTWQHARPLSSPSDKWPPAAPPAPGCTVLAVNLGGGVIPAASSIYLLHHAELHSGKAIIAVAVMTLICRLTSKPVAGVGISMPLLIPPLAAASCGLALDPAQSAPLSYVCGTLGVLLGADISRLGDIRRMGGPLASIGGAGTFDGIFLTGLVAALLA